MSSAEPFHASRRRTALAFAGALLASLLPIGAVAQEGPFASNLTLVPTEDTAPSGTCNEFTARVTGEGDTPGGTPVEGVTVDVLQTLQNRGGEPSETRELSFCNPQNAAGPNPTGSGGTSFGDVSGNNPGATAGDFGRNTSVHGEVGPTDANGEVTFGITMTPPPTAGTVTVTAWYELEDDDEQQVEGEPTDSSTKTWVGNEGLPVTALDAAPESSTNPNGSQHTVTVVVSNGGNPLQGVVPDSVIAADGTGRPAGDVANPSAGASPNFVPGTTEPAYTCTASDAQGFSTCTLQDPADTPAGTDTIVFFVDQAGVAGEPDDGDPQDAVQKTWVAPGPPPTTPPTATPTATPTSTPGPAAPEARNIRLCHGSTAGAATCDTAPHARGPEDLHEVAALVTDRAGNPLANVPVELREIGPAVFTPSGTSSALVTTGSDGIARAVLTSDQFGTSTITAEISPAGTTGSLRGPGAADDECEQPAGTGGVPGAGNCVSQALTVTWEDAHPAECIDGHDNDGDGFVDFGDDPSCTSEDDDTEEPVDEPDNGLEKHRRRINMRFRDWVGPGDEGLVIFGRLRLVDEEDDFRKCTQGQPVRIQRLVDGEWVTRKHATTNARGRYAGVVFDRPGRYRAVAPRAEILDDIGIFHICRPAEKAKRHHHRR